MAGKQGEIVRTVPFAEHLPLGFEITRVRKIIAHAAAQHDPTRLHRIDFCGLIFADRGPGWHTIDFQEHPLQHGDLVFLGSGRVQRFSEAQDFDGMLILFTENFLFRKAAPSSAVLLNLLYPPVGMPVVVPADERVTRSLELLQSEYDEAEPFAKADILRALLDYLLLQVCRLRRTVPGPDADRHAGLFARFFELVQEHFRSTRNAADYAEMLALSYKHLNTICKEVCRSTARSAIDRYVLLEAKRLLATGNASVEEVSAALGFDEATNFIKYFKRLAGSTPAQFRRSLTAGQVRV